MCPSDAVHFHVFFQALEVFGWCGADCCAGVPEGEAVVNEAEGVEEAWVLCWCQVSVLVVRIVYVGI